MNITINISDDMLAEVVKSLAAKSFAPPERYTNEGGAGYEAIRTAVRGHVTGIDFEPMIRAKVAEVMGRVVNDVLEEEIRKQAKAKVKELAKAGTLFDTTTEGDSR